MKDSDSIRCIARILYPFMLLFGCYIIIFGDVSPGGGFQGGVILATARLVTLYIPEKADIDVEIFNLAEKLLFLLLLLLGVLSLFTVGGLFTNVLSAELPHEIRRWFLVILNLAIGIKVSSGLTLIFTQFVKEGE